MSFLALRDLMRIIGYSSATAWIFPAIIDTAVAVSTLMLVALGDKPARRARSATTCAGTQISAMQPSARPLRPTAKAEVVPAAPISAQAHSAKAAQLQTTASVQRSSAQGLQGSTQTESQPDANLASELIASGVTTQPVETVLAVLAARRGGASINAAAKASGINYRTAQRIVAAAAEQRQRQLVAVG